MFVNSQKIGKIGATICQILRPKCIKFVMYWGSAPDLAGGAYSAPPRLTVFNGTTSKGKERKGKEGERGRKE